MATDRTSGRTTTVRERATALGTQTVDALSVPRDARPIRYEAIPEGWRHAPLVERLHGLDPSRRETALAAGLGAGALLAGLLGIIAVLGGWGTLFVALLVVGAAVAFAPRPPVRRWRARLAHHVGGDVDAGAGQSSPRSTR